MDNSLIILAGGKGTRFGTIGKALPKCMLVVYDQLIIQRSIIQAISAGIDKIFISINPTLYIKVKNILADISFNKKVQIIIIKNRFHKEGALFALQFILHKYTFNKVFITYGDTYFLNNPFGESKKIFIDEKDYFFGSKISIYENFNNAGVIMVSHTKKIRSIVKPASWINKNCYIWNGLWCVDARKTLVILSKYLRDYSKEKPDEDYLNFFLSLSKNVYMKKSSTFINVNNPIDLFMASICRLKEINKLSTNLNLHINELSKYLQMEIDHS